MANEPWIYQKSPSIVVPATARGVGNVPGAAEKVLEFFSSTGPISTSVKNLNSTVNNFSHTINGTNLKGQINEDVYKRLKYQYANLYVALGTGTAANAIGGAENSIVSSINAASDNITKSLKPVSSFMGSTLGTLTGVMKDPVGSLYHLPDTIGSMLDRTNPSLKAKYNATFQKYHLDKLGEMPGQLFGSIQQITKAIDGVLAIPLNLINDIYHGIMDLMKQINDFITGIMAAIQKLITNIIDGLFPGLLDFLDTLNTFANQIGGITQIFAGSSQILGFTNQLIGFSSQINGFIQNPLDLAFAKLPPSVNSYMNVLQNPQALINQHLPPQLSQYFSKISSVTGFGFNGNMGFGLQSVLGGLQGGVISGIMQGFSTQFSILAPLFQYVNQTPNTYHNQADTLRIPNGPSYNVGKAGGQVVQVNVPQPVYGNRK